MSFEVSFNEMSVEDILSCAKEHKAAGWRFIQLLCVNTDNGIDVQYTYMKDTLLENWTVCGVQKDTVIPSVSNEFLSAFVFENEAHDLFGVNISGIVIDFRGRFYDLAMNEPMTVISPEQKAAREKAARIAAAQAAKKNQAVGTREDSDVKPASQDSANSDAKLEKKLEGMDPEKAAKVRAALEAKKKKDVVTKTKNATDMSQTQNDNQEEAR